MKKLDVKRAGTVCKCFIDAVTRVFPTQCRQYKRISSEQTMLIQFTNDIKKKLHWRLTNSDTVKNNAQNLITIDKKNGKLHYYMHIYRVDWNFQMAKLAIEDLHFWFHL